MVITTWDARESPLCTSLGEAGSGVAAVAAVAAVVVGADGVAEVDEDVEEEGNKRIVY